MEKKLNLNTIPVVLINLPHRTERLIQSHKQLNDFYGERKIYKMDGVTHSTPKIGIATAHMNCIRLAKEKKWKYVCIAEDDLFFTSERSREYANKCFENVPEDFDILLGGVYGSPNFTDYNSYWDRVTNFCGLQYYIVSQKAYDKILKFDFTGNIDLWLGKNNHNLNCYVSRLYFALQVDGYSDNALKQTDYLQMIPVNKILK